MSDPDGLSGAQNAADHARGPQKRRTPFSSVCGKPLLMFEQISLVHTWPQPIVDTHRNALSRYTEATEGPTVRHPLSFFRIVLIRISQQPDEEVASRCETVLNTTMAEIETYHTQKVEDFALLATEHLDGEIEFYEQVSFKEKSPPFLLQARLTIPQPSFTSCHAPFHFHLQI